jgi:hypothetical protein
MNSRKLLASLMAMGLLVQQCSVPSSDTNLEINGFNYTDLYIDSFSVNSQGGGNIFVSSPTSGGGGSVCCIGWHDSYEPPIIVTVEWSYDREHYCKQEVTIEEPYPENPNHLGVHFFQDGHVEVNVTEDYPELKLILEHANHEERKESGNEIPRCMNPVTAP